MKDTEVSLDRDQLHAIEICTTMEPTHRIAAVTGQAGTGKTTILRKAYESLAHAGYRIALGAPTGKAAKRIREVTGIPAQTIHRLLEYPHPGERDEKTGKPLSTTEPKRHKFHPLEYDVVFVDEAAMLNHEVYRNVVDALPRGGFIRFFGDVNQLPPIEQDKRKANAPTPFESVLSKYASARLETIYRQGEGSGIVRNGDLILKGRLPERLQDFAYKVTMQPVDEVMRFVRESDIDFSSINHQIICPTKKGWVGTVKLNAILQTHYMQGKVNDWTQLPRHPWARDENTRVAAGDKVIWTQNNYDLDEGRGVFNGETGTILETSSHGEVVIDFGDRIVVVPATIETQRKDGSIYAYDPRRDLDLAYAVTTHKAQGSQFESVLYVMNSSRPYTLNKNNFYTAVTRAEKFVQIITDQKALSLSMRKSMK